MKKLNNKNLTIIFGIFLGLIVVTYLVLVFSNNSTINKLVKPAKESAINQKLYKVVNNNPYQEVLLNARKQIGVVTSYDTSYYQEAFPPADSGACADVIWRAFSDSGFDFKKTIDDDIVKNTDSYPSKPPLDNKINFRRVRNIKTFLDNNSKSLTTKVIPNNFENLKEWQGGDIVTYEQIPGGLWHIAIISNKRNQDGVPFLIHNFGQGVKERGIITDWPTKVSGHYRFTDLNTIQSN